MTASDSERHGDDPHAILGVARDASPEDVRGAYRRLLRVHRPESDPTGFQRIRAAYEELRGGGYEFDGQGWDHADHRLPPGEVEEVVDLPGGMQMTILNDPAPGADPDVREWHSAGDDEREPDAAAAQLAPAMPPAFDGRALAARLVDLDRSGRSDDVGAEFDRRLGDLALRAPGEAAALAVDVLESLSFSPQLRRAAVRWIEQLDMRDEWLLDRVEHLIQDDLLAEEVARAKGKTGYPDPFLDLLRDQFDFYGDQLCDACSQVFERRHLGVRAQRRWAKNLRRGYPHAWSAWRKLRERLMDLTEGVRSHGGESIDGREARRRAWALMRRMDKPIDKDSNMPITVICIVILWFTLRMGSELSGVWLALLIIGAVVAVVVTVAIAQRRSFLRYVVPTLRRELPAKGLSAADLACVLVERPADFKHWDEVEAAFRQAAPLWLFTASALRSEPKSPED